MPGVKGRSGRKTRAHELGLEKTLEQCFTAAEREKCIKQLVADCRSDDFHERHESRKLLMAYAYGKPKESVEHGGRDGGPIEVVVRYVSKPAKN